MPSAHTKPSELADEGEVQVVRVGAEWKPKGNGAVASGAARAQRACGNGLCFPHALV